MGFEDLIRNIIREELSAFEERMNKPAAGETDLPPILSPKQAAEYMHISLSVMYDLTNHKDFPSYKVGRHKKIPRDQFLKWANDYQIKRGVQ